MGQALSVSCAGALTPGPGAGDETRTPPPSAQLTPIPGRRSVFASALGRRDSPRIERVPCGYVLVCVRARPSVRASHARRRRRLSSRPPPACLCPSRHRPPHTRRPCQTRPGPARQKAAGRRPNQKSSPRFSAVFDLGGARRLRLRSSCSIIGTAAGINSTPRFLLLGRACSFR